MKSNGFKAMLVAMTFVIGGGVSLAGASPANAEICYAYVNGVPVGTYDDCSHPVDPNRPPPVVPPVAILKLVLLTQSTIVHGPTPVTISARLADSLGNVRNGAGVSLCWKEATASTESCTQGTTNSVGVASTVKMITTTTTIRATVPYTTTSTSATSAKAEIRVTPVVRATASVRATAGVRTLTITVNPASRAKVTLQKKVGIRYANIRSGYTTTRGTGTFTKLTRGAYYRVYVYPAAGRRAMSSPTVRVR
ncbi:MAG: hypothetical protein ACOH1Y_16770 [Propionicimonas sp.]